MDIYARDPLASGGFIGEASIGEQEENTKRFQVYIKLAGTFFDPNKFRHHANANASSYFLESLTNPQAGLKEMAEDMFHKLYVLPRALQPANIDTSLAAQTG